MRRRIIAGNWKMNKTIPEALELVRELRLGLKDCANVEVVVCPPFTTLSIVGQEIEGTAMSLGAQNVFWEEKGAYTGEISPHMLRDAHCRYVIIGHSERRHIFRETDEQVNRKIRAALGAELTPIVCVGERLEERQANKTFEVISGQLRGGFASLQSAEMQRIVIAYEPVWAIGTGQNATPAQAQEVHAFIRNWLVKAFDKDTGAAMRIQYGGSVTAENSAALIGQPDVDGALVGGASLKAESFLKIVQAAAC
ncbi:MAG: triose-phosphate isomerase [Candidatus Omnitrophica bacterium]|nr:triose-phosphate isomerase [Candidatus Omnitrophota bacterium]